MSEAAVREQVEHGHHDPVAARIGMWLFLFTEVLLFGALFIAFAVYLNTYRWDFESASRHLNKAIGAGNTLVLLTSSLTMALAIAAIERGKRQLCLGMLAATIFCALAFLAVKSFEWRHEFDEGIYPRSEHLLGLPPGEQVFFGLYFVMTGLHGLHVLVGAVAIAFAVVFIQKGKIRPGRIVFLGNVGLYWHLVDIIWIFLFPLFYLIG